METAIHFLQVSSVPSIRLIARSFSQLGKQSVELLQMRSTLLLHPIITAPVNNFMKGIFCPIPSLEDIHTVKLKARHWASVICPWCTRNRWLGQVQTLIMTWHIMFHGLIIPSEGIIPANMDNIVMQSKLLTLFWLEPWAMSRLCLSDFYTDLQMQIKSNKYPSSYFVFFLRFAIKITRMIVSTR